MDQIDRKILALMQADASLSVSEIAERVGLSSTPCWRRIQRLKEDGVIERQVVLCNAEKLNLGVTVFVAVRTNQHNDEWLRRFAQVAAQIPEVVEIYRMSGETDYLLRVAAPSIGGYDRIYKKIVSMIELSDVSSNFAMEVIKHTTALPLDYAE